MWGEKIKKNKLPLWFQLFVKMRFGGYPGYHHQLTESQTDKRVRVIRWCGLGSHQNASSRSIDPGQYVKKVECNILCKMGARAVRIAKRFPRFACPTLLFPCSDYIGLMQIRETGKTMQQSSTNRRNAWKVVKQHIREFVPRWKNSKKHLANRLTWVYWPCASWQKVRVTVEAWDFFYINVPKLCNNFYCLLIHQSQVPS